MPERIHSITEIKKCLEGGDHLAILQTSPKIQYHVRTKSALLELHSLAASEGLQLEVVAGEEYLDMFYMFSLVMVNVKENKILHELGTLFCHNAIEGRKILEEIYAKADPAWTLPEIRFFKI